MVQGVERVRESWIFSKKKCYVSDASIDWLGAIHYGWVPSCGCRLRTFSEEWLVLRDECEELGILSTISPWSVLYPSVIQSDYHMQDLMIFKIGTEIPGRSGGRSGPSVADLSLLAGLGSKTARWLAAEHDRFWSLVTHAREEES